MQPRAVRPTATSRMGLGRVISAPRVTVPRMVLRRTTLQRAILPIVLRVPIPRAIRRKAAILLGMPPLMMPSKMPMPRFRKTLRLRPMLRLQILMSLSTCSRRAARKASCAKTTGAESKASMSRRRKRSPSCLTPTLRFTMMRRSRLSSRAMRSSPSRLITACLSRALAAMSVRSKAGSIGRWTMIVPSSLRLIGRSLITSSCLAKIIGSG